MYSRQGLQVVFPHPGFFFVDARFLVMLDGRVMYDGGFDGGFELDVPCTPGRHTLATTIDLGPLKEGEIRVVVIAP